MSRRRRREEMEFGSDSFLDVVANVVGILIILMVLAGIRAKHAPVNLDEDSAPPVAVTAPPVEMIPVTAEADEAAEARHRELAELQTLTETLEEEINGLRRTASEQETKLSELQSQNAAQRNRVTAITSSIDAEVSELLEQQRQTQKLLADAQKVRMQLRKRNGEAIVAGKQPNRIEKLQHRITPVSRVITENETELHFRCLGGVVASVPLDELIERMKGQVERMKEFILRTKKYSGTVGPVRSWSLNYVIETQQHLGMVRASVSQFELVPDSDLDGERAEIALRPESVFRNELRKAEPGSTITFWVYPDSFVLFRKLQALAHREGFTVAARPLPEGTPIMGSPNGSRSAAQ